MSTGINLLVIDDDEVDRMALRRSLAASDFQAKIEEAVDAKSGLKLILSGQYDCVFLDYLLPDMDGLALLREIRTKGISTPIVVYTARGDERIAVEMMKAGASDYIPKSLLSTDGIGQVIKSVLRVRNAELLLQKNRAALESSEAHLKSLLHFVPIGVFETDLDGNCTYVNPEWLSIVGINEAAAMGKGWAGAIYSEDREKVSSAWQSSIRENKPFAMEYRFRDSEGNGRWVSGRAILQKDSSGNKVGYLGVIQDISERKKYENQLLEAREAAMVANKAKSEFLANMSHEIRTPMNSIMGMADLLIETPLSEEQRQYINTFRAASQGLLSLLNDILDLSKIEAGEMAIELRAFNLSHALKRVIDLMGLRARQKGILLEFEIDRALPGWFMGDANRFKQIIFNLIGNALKFTSAGSVQVKIEGAFASSGLCELHVSVADTGIGMSREQCGRLFQRFTQADSSITRRFGGTGLGLSICRQLVELMGGTIGVESTEGKGSKFYFSLPLQVAEAQAEPESALFMESASFSSETPPMKILLVDDQADNRTLILAYLKKTAHQITTAENGLDALEKFKAGSFDFVLMDMQMEVMDGYTSTAAIRRWEAETSRPPVPIIALTAYALSDDHAKSLAAGCTAHVTKPIQKAVLLNVIRQFSGSRSTES